MLYSPPQPHPSFTKSKKIHLAENVNENTYFFYLCLYVSVVSSSALPAFVSLSSQFSACLLFFCFVFVFLHLLTNPVISTGLFFAHVFVNMHLLPP